MRNNSINPCQVQKKNMETNRCDVSRLDADSLLPPRKRLLAGLKRQNTDAHHLEAASATNCIGGEYDERTSSPLKLWLSDPNLSYEEIAESSRIAAIEAARIAVAARANAEEKAAKAAKAVSAAKNALELVSDLSEETALAEKYVRKNKLKKQKPVTALYSRSKDNTDNKATDEELARKLHQSINSSPRILKNSSGTDAKIHRQKRLKSSALSVEARNDINASVVEATSNGSNVVVGEADLTRIPVNKIDMLMIDLNASEPHECHQVRLRGEQVQQPDMDDQPHIENGERKTTLDQSKDKQNSESVDSFGRKKGRLKQKKLPLSTFGSKDHGMGQDHSKPPFEDNAVAERSFSLDVRSLMPVERASL